LPHKEVLYNIAETIGMMKDGISHVLFVIKDAFTEEERKNFKLLKEVMFESGITPYATIVRTNFDLFRDEEECELDKQDLLDESEDIAEIIKECNGLVHVDNPSLIKVSESEILSRKEKKQATRQKILDCLKSNYRGNYKLKSWDKIYLRINNYLSLIKRGNDTNLEKEKEIVIEQVAVIIQQEVPSVAKQQESKKSSGWCLIL